MKPKKYNNFLWEDKPSVWDRVWSFLDRLFLFLMISAHILSYAL